MYKTVRHGENSLQYKILAQEEEGMPGVKRRKSPKAVVVKLIAIMTLLVVGVIASAFLVPLLLANDFIAVTGTFQKFSVSTLRRSHSGNHVVVIAKKPYGWNAARIGAPSVDPEKLLPTTVPASAATRPPPTVGTTARMAPPPPPLTTAPTTLAPPTSKSTTSKTTTREPATESASRSTERIWGFVKFPPTKAVAHQEQSFRKGGEESEVVSSKLEPIWYKPLDKWEFQSARNYINKANEDGIPFLLLVAIVILLVVSLLVVYCLFKVTLCILCRRKGSTEKETAETKEHRKRLLKSSASANQDED